jgi:hypothetical protein
VAGWPRTREVPAWISLDSAEKVSLMRLADPCSATCEGMLQYKL